MLVLVVMLVAALLPTATPLWQIIYSFEFAGVPAQCFYEVLTQLPVLDSDASAWIFTSSAYDVPAAMTGIVSMCYLILSYLVRAIKLSQSGSNFARLWLRKKPGNLAKKLLDNLHGRSRRGKATIAWLFAYEVLLVLFVIGRAGLDLFESMLWEVSVSSYNFRAHLFLCKLLVLRYYPKPYGTISMFSLMTSFFRSSGCSMLLLGGLFVCF